MTSPGEQVGRYALFAGPLDGLHVYVGPCEKHGRMPILIVERDANLSVKYPTVDVSTWPDEIVYRFNDELARYEYSNEQKKNSRG